jgi:hypothetical protein
VSEDPIDAGQHGRRHDLDAPEAAPARDDRLDLGGAWNAPPPPVDEAALRAMLREAEARAMSRVTPPGAKSARRMLVRRRRRLAATAGAAVVAVTLASAALAQSRTASIDGPVEPSSGAATACTDSGVAAYVGNQQFEILTKVARPLCPEVRITIRWAKYSVDSAWTATRIGSGESYLDAGRTRASVPVPPPVGCGVRVWTAFDFALPETFQIDKPHRPETAVDDPALFYDKGRGRTAVAHHEITGC